MSNLLFNAKNQINCPGISVPKNRRIILLAILINLFLFSFLLSASATTGIINTDNVNVRSGPGTSYDAVGQFNQGSKVEILGARNDWYQIKTANLNGWVNAPLINVQKEYQVKVTGNSVNLRSGPGTNYEVTGYTNQGDILDLLDVSGDWYQIRNADGLKAYIAASLTEKFEKNTPPVSNIEKPQPVPTTPVPPKTTTQVEVVSGSVFLRNGPGSNYSDVGKTSEGEIFTVLGQEGDWYKIRLADSSSAYIAGWLVRPTSTPAPAPVPATPGTSLTGAPVVIMDGRQLSFEVPPVIENDRTLVPLRAIFEAMGASVDWDNNTRTVISVKDTTTVVLPIGSTSPTVNGKVWPLDVAAKIKNDRTLAPLRFVGEAFGGTVNWDNSTRTISITSPPAPATPGSRAGSVLVKGDQTNLRSGPSSSYDTVDSAREGEKLPILAQRDGWYQVSRGGRTAWVAGWVVDLYIEDETSGTSPEPVEEEPVPEPPKKPEKPGADVIWLSLVKDEKGLQICMDSGAKLDADIKESRSKVTYEFKDRQIEGLNLVKQSLVNGELKAKARNAGDNTTVEIEFPYGTIYQTASEEGGKREVFIIPNAINSVELREFGNVGERLIISTITPAKYSSSKKGDIVEIRLDGVGQGKARNEYEYKSTVIESVTFEETQRGSGATIVKINTTGLAKYTMGQSADGTDFNILMVGKSAIKDRRENLVVLDPGHGGKDTGARGVHIDEKDVTLKIALKVGELLEKKGIDVEYTRKTDKYLELNASRDEISEIANRLNAGVFVSIHINSAENKSAQGTETWYYAPVNNDLLFLQQDERKSLAEHLQRHLVDKCKRPDRGIKQKGYWVLKNTTMPSALVEVAFISNPEEERLLQQEYFINLAAEGIAEGIAEYMGK